MGKHGTWAITNFDNPNKCSLPEIYGSDQFNGFDVSKRSSWVCCHSIASLPYAQKEKFVFSAVRPVRPPILIEIIVFRIRFN